MLVLAVTQVLSTAVVFGGGAEELSSGSSEPAITPAGYAFVIWTIPVLSCLVHALHAWRRTGSEPYRSIAWPLAATMAGFDLWLWLATRGWVWATVVVFAAMLACLGVALRAARRHPAHTRGGRIVITTTLGVYAGWTTVAVWANLAAALHADGRGLANTDTGWQLALLLGAGLSAVIGVWLTRAQLTYLAAVLWALIAVVVATADRGAPVLEFVAVVATALTAATALLRAGSRRRHGSASERTPVSPPRRDPRRPGHRTPPHERTGPVLPSRSQPSASGSTP